MPYPDYKERICISTDYWFHEHGVDSTELEEGTLHCESGDHRSWALWVQTGLTLWRLGQEGLKPWRSWRKTWTRLPSSGVWVNFSSKKWAVVVKRTWSGKEHTWTMHLNMQRRADTRSNWHSEDLRLTSPSFYSPGTESNLSRATRVWWLVPGKAS